MMKDCFFPDMRVEEQQKLYKNNLTKAWLWGVMVWTVRLGFWITQKGPGYKDYKNAVDIRNPIMAQY